MNLLLRLEYAALFVFSIFLFSFSPYAWWWYPLLLLVPDVGMLGYLVSPKIGSFTYNATHWIFLAFAFYIYGWQANLPALELAGITMIGHSSLDRVLGFGLKYPDSFKHTHLGTLA